MQEIWNELLGFEYINEILIGVGVLLVVIGLFKILRNGLRIVLWIALTVVGGFGVAHGLDRSSNSVTIDLSDKLGPLIEPGKEFLIEKLQNACRILDTSDSAQSAGDLIDGLRRVVD